MKNETLCRKCKKQTRVTNTYHEGGIVRRRRFCRVCKLVFQTTQPNETRLKKAIIPV